MKLSSYLNPKFIVTELEAGNIKEAIALLIENMARHSTKIAENEAELTETTLRRENEISTCVGNGIAIPHGRIPNFEDLMVAVGVLKAPVEMEIASSGKKDRVKLVFLILSDVLKNKNILKLMSGVSKLALQHPETLHKLKEETNPKEI
ncbi:MAG: PTS sugar transporter subunit IIA, partial [Fusobacteriaceae bacterium]|nr:PTS sugar transporter subunit IIA [Fusobacteriaceae bacterium]